MKKIIKTVDKYLFFGFMKKLYYKLKYERGNSIKINALNLKPLSTPEKRLISLVDLLNKSSNEGVVVECGVGYGHSLSIISKYFINTNKVIYAFDSFEGYPDETHGKDLDNIKNRKWNYKLMTLDLVKNNLRNREINEKFINNNIVFKKGFFPDSFVGFNEKVSFLQIDVNLYKSVKDCLNFFYPKLVNGGIICLWENFSDEKWIGSKKAVDEFVNENNIKLLEHFSTLKYIIKE